MAPTVRAPRLPPEQMRALQGTSLEELPWEREIQMDHCGRSGPTPRGQPVWVKKNLRRGPFWPGWGDHVNTRLLGPSLVAALRGQCGGHSGFCVQPRVTEVERGCLPSVGACGPLTKQQGVTLGLEQRASLRRRGWSRGKCEQSSLPTGRLVGQGRPQATLGDDGPAHRAPDSWHFCHLLPHCSEGHPHCMRGEVSATQWRLLLPVPSTSRDPDDQGHMS